MAECSKCGKESMSFKCKYCGEKFCSEHRLPEKHDCGDMEEAVEKEKEETGKWFQEREVRNTLEPSQPRKPSLFQEVKNTLSNNYTLSIIIFTTFVFFIQMMLRGLGPEQQFYNLLILQPGIENVLSQPWSLITVLFLHGGLFHLFANMITLYFFGTPVERAIGSREFLKFYFGAGIVSSLGFVAFRNILELAQAGSLGPAVGASGAVVACFAAVAMLYPRAEVLLYFFIPMKIKTALYLFAGIEVLNMLAKLGGVYLPVIGGFASSAHLTGLAVGIWYGKKLREKHSTRAGTIDLLGY